ncbi:hypothetical protein NQ318_014201 [Aromia moschata]|uniref:Uncharacterized protein n=1 Tax=Aromia moschata TaxID=1265417 RepID=A0AAV8X538_9CUCU|nr:hypothetical protein NQ318_014201 [Aromia moschata]
MFRKSKEKETNKSDSNNSLYRDCDTNNLYKVFFGIFNKEKLKVHLPSSSNPYQYSFTSIL